MVPSPAPSSTPSGGKSGGDLPSYCIIDNEGFVHADDQVTKETVLDYRYKIISNTTRPILETEVLPLVEHRLLEIILGDILECDELMIQEGMRSDRRLSLSSAYLGAHGSSRKLGLIGASSSPPDRVADGKLKSKQLLQVLALPGVLELNVISHT